jgi:hypothetical protein
LGLRKDSIVFQDWRAKIAEFVRNLRQIESRQREGSGPTSGAEAARLIREYQSEIRGRARASEEHLRRAHASRNRRLAVLRLGRMAFSLVGSIPTAAAAGASPGLDAAKGALTAVGLKKLEEIGADVGLSGLHAAVWHLTGRRRNEF